MPRLFLLPGLGADERMFEALGASGLPLAPARLPVPEPDEPMPAYSLRVAALIPRLHIARIALSISVTKLSSRNIKA